MHWILSILLVSILNSGTPRNISSSEQNQDTTTVSAAQLADLIESQARMYLGKPYRYGASGPRAFDCSGFVRFVYDKFGYELGRSSTDQFKEGRPVEGDYTKLQKGDIVTFSGSRNSKTPGHSGIFLHLDPGGESFTFIHAARGGVQISKSSEDYYNKRFLGARRIIPDFLTSEIVSNVSDEEYAADMQKQLPVRDTLSLGGSDIRIVALSKGSWYIADNEGNLRKPSADSSIVLSSDGRWKYIPNSRISIPGSAMQTQKKENVSEPAAAPVSDQVVEEEYYVIRQGDTLSRIAANHHTTVRKLCELNNMTETTILRIGRKIRIR